jgi:hypothetical protein
VWDTERLKTALLIQNARLGIRAEEEARKK